MHEEIVAKSKLCFSKISFQFSETEGVYVCAYVCERMSMQALEREVCMREQGMCMCVWHMAIYSILCQHLIG